MAQPVLAADSLVKAFGHNRYALRGIDLAVPSGTVLGILGRNGAGKTTLLQCALGLLRPTAGSIALLGEDAWNLSAAAKQQIGYAPQEPTLHGWMQVEYLLNYTGAFYEHWSAPLVADLVRQWDIPTGQRVETLSVGQFQKLSILLAMGHEPKLLILDEPAASLDPVARRQFLAQVLEIATPGSERTVVFSTHITSDLERVADTVAILRDGLLSYHGELDVLKDTVKRLHISADRPLIDDKALVGDCKLLGKIERSDDDHSAVLTLRGSGDDWLDRWRDRDGLRIEVEDLNLEDIFLQIHC